MRGYAKSVIALLLVACCGCVTERSRVSSVLSSGQSEPRSVEAHAASQRSSKSSPIRLVSLTAPEDSDSPGNQPGEEEVDGPGGDERDNSTLLPPPIDVSPETSGLTLDAFVSAAIASSPAVAEARAAASKAAGVRQQVGLRPNPTLSYVAEEIGADGAGGLHNVNLSQTFVRGGKLSWNRAVVDRDVQRLLFEADAQRIRVRTDVTIRFYELLAARRRSELAGQFLDTVEAGVELAEERLEAGEGTQADVLQAEVLRSEVELRRRQAEVAEAAASRRLSVVSGIEVSDADELAGELRVGNEPQPFETLVASLTASSPEVFAARAEVERARRNISRQQVQPIPNVTGLLGVGQDFASDNTFANVGVSLPVPLHNRNKGNIAAAQADYCRATQKLARVRQRLADRLAAALQQRAAARIAATQYQEEIVPRAARSLDLIEQAYEVGEVDYLRVLTARRAAFDAEFALVAAEFRAATQEAALDGYLLSGSLRTGIDYEGGDSLRDQALTGR